MREKQDNKMPILIPSMEHPQAKELQRISDILDETLSSLRWSGKTLLAMFKPTAQEAMG